jgi:hypothetical protein
MTHRGVCRECVGESVCQPTRACHHGACQAWGMRLAWSSPPSPPLTSRRDVPSLADIDEALGVSALDKLRGKLGVAPAMARFTYSVSAGVRFIVRLLGRCEAESKRVSNAVRPGGGGAW